MSKKRKKHHGPKASHKVCSVCGRVYKRSKGHACKGAGGGPKRGPLFG